MGILLSFIPIYSTTGLIYTSYAYPELGGEEWLDLYHSKVMFGIFEGRYTNGLASFIPGVASILLLYRLKFQKINKLKSLNIFFLVLSSIFTMLGIFRFM